MLLLEVLAYYFLFAMACWAIEAIWSYLRLPKPDSPVFHTLDKIYEKMDKEKDNQNTMSYRDKG